MRRMVGRAVAGAATALVTALAALGTGTGAWAAAPASDDGYAPGMVAAMQRDLGLSHDDALGVLAFQKDAAATERSLAAQLGDTYGGAWIDARSRVLHVGVTDPSKDQIVRDAGAEPFDCHHPKSQLDRWMSDLNQAVDPTTAGEYYVDVPNNRIVLDVLRGHMGDVKHAVRDVGIPKESVAYTQSDEPPQTASNVIGGNPYFINNATRCSVGFPTTGGGFVTAGHCGTVGATTTNPSGSFTLSSFPGHDYAFVQVAAGNPLIAAVNTFAGSSLNIAGATPAAVGAAVCRAGATTGWQCGTLQSLNTTVNYAQGSVTTLLRTTACAEPGDSGGSLVAGDQAQGVTSGVSGNCTTGATSFFQPVQPILDAAGVAILTRTGAAVPTACSGSVTTVSTTLPAGATATTGAFTASRIGFLLGCLDLPVGATFSLILQQQNADTTWTTIGQAPTASPDEYLTVPTTAGAAYRWQVHATAGTGVITIGWTAP